MPWIVLLFAAMLEAVWALALKQSEGMTRMWPTVIGGAIALASLALLTIALRSLPIGTAYSVWTGLGAVGVVLAGAVALGESISPARLVFLALIFVGVIGLRLAEG